MEQDKPVPFDELNSHLSLQSDTKHKTEEDTRIKSPIFSTHLS